MNANSPRDAAMVRGMGFQPMRQAVGARVKNPCHVSAICALLVMVMTGVCLAQQRPQPVPAVRQEAGKLIYAADEKGNRVPDFSYCGYKAGDEPVPNVPVRVVVSPAAGDNTSRIQHAIDYVASLPIEQRGAVLLTRGRFEVSGGLRLNASGVVLRGSGAGPDGTVLVATGTDRRTFVTIAGRDDSQYGPAIAVADSYVPVNATSLRIQNGSAVKKGDSVVVRRPSTREWVVELGMDDLGGDRHGPAWRPGSRDLVWDRAVTSVDSDRITIDAPITCALDSQYRGGTVATYTWPGRITNVGVENLSCESTFDKANPKDEDHAWFGVTIENAADCWVRQVNFRHFTGSAVAVYDSAKRVTVEDCKSTEPIGEIGGWRRNTFFVSGQQVLMQRLWAEDGRHDFGAGFLAAGPNAFVQCESLRSTHESGGIDSWSCGTLFDLVRIDGAPLSLRNRMYLDQGSGWSAANSVLWNSTAPLIENWRPPTAQNWAFGTWGEFSGNGYWFGSNDSVDPDSLFYAQLTDRIGPAAKDRAHLLLIKTNASSSPSIETAAELIRITKQPSPLLSDFIDNASKHTPIPIAPDGAKQIDELPAPKVPTQLPVTKTLAASNGWLVIDGQVVLGASQGVPWWNGTVRVQDFSRIAPALTRFVPGRYGRGLTDDLEQVAQDMLRRGTVAVEQHPPLWYDRRRDDHERIRRMDGDVVAPFFEWPFARSGQGLAFDGLSKWDLTRPNPFYYSRLREFADIGAREGLVLVNMHYMQHSILEAGAHYADFPWRTANNINDTPFPEPIYYAGDKRVFVGEQFYDVTNPTLAALHRQYIRRQLDELSNQPNVIHMTSQEYTGPLEFVQFWLDTIGQWQKETGRDVIVALSATKDVQDGILSDPSRAAVVDVIDIRYWWYMSDGQAYAPKGGLNLAPRQHARISRDGSGGTSPQQVYRAVNEYRSKFPEKAVMYSAGAGGESAVAALMGGASMVPARVPTEIQRLIPKLRPVTLPGDTSGAWALGDDGENYVVFASDGASPKLDESKYAPQRFDVGGGSMIWFKRM